MYDLVPAPDAARRTRELTQLVLQLHLPRGRLTADALTTLVVAVASRPCLYEDVMVGGDAQGRWWMLLHEAANFDLRVLSWEREQETDWHDHGGSAGAYVVTRGALLERFRDNDDAAIGCRRMGVGQFATFGASHIHEVTHWAGAPAVGVHAYSPPLTGLTLYDRTDLGFVAKEVAPEEHRAPYEVRAESSWRPNGSWPS